MDDTTAKSLQHAAESLLEKVPVPAVWIAIDDGDGVRRFGRGQLNVDTAVDATTDRLFQIGSITKLFTATLVMQLVDEGLVALDDPGERHVPPFESRFDKCTVRHLLSHTSGLDGDYFASFGFSDDAIQRYVEASAALPQLFCPARPFPTATWVRRARPSCRTGTTRAVRPDRDHVPVPRLTKRCAASSEVGACPP